MTPRPRLRRREAATVSALIDAVVAPEPPLPPVPDTDALPAFADWLSRAPQPNRAGVHALLAALEIAGPLARFSALDRGARLASLRRLNRVRAMAPLAEALRSIASVSYYGDAGVLATLGHDPVARVREARERRARGATP